jgi:2-polyprenyl-3-methyl-5-hydroxy-6-metoxy-1,4-benzoquinol methylase/uncharacterized protein YbaR (Trm112 family)
VDAVKRELLRWLACPACGGALEIRAGAVTGVRGEIRSAALGCRRCRSVVPVRDYIPRFVGSDNYAASFGYEWRRHARTQLDSASGTSLSRDRFFRTTGWPSRMAGERVLEVGCGAGRFSEVALATGCELTSVDISEAVDVALENHGLHPSWHPVQADVYRLPFRARSFDRVFCLGVLQHCPDVDAAFPPLAERLQDGGSIAIDVYERTLKVYATPRFWLRLVTSRMRPEQLYRAVARAVPVLRPARRFIRERIPGGRYLAALIPVAYYDGILPLSDAQLEEWSILDTFDILSPRHEHRVGLARVRGWFEDAGLEVDVVAFGGNGIVGTGRRPTAAALAEPAT